MIVIFTEEDIDNVIKDLNIKFDKNSKKDFITGLNVELEHGLVDSNTNVTNNDIMKTAKIVL